jgi:hypothetical protein
MQHTIQDKYKNNLKAKEGLKYDSSRGAVQDCEGQINKLIN